jgi:hypothetical protein
VKCNLQQQTTKGKMMSIKEWAMYMGLVSFMWMLYMIPAMVAVAYGMPAWIAIAWGAYAGVKAGGLGNV